MRWSRHENTLATNALGSTPVANHEQETQNNIDRLGPDEVLRIHHILLDRIICYTTKDQSSGRHVCDLPPKIAHYCIQSLLRKAERCVQYEPDDKANTTKADARRITGKYIGRTYVAARFLARPFFYDDKNNVVFIDYKDGTDTAPSLPKIAKFIGDAIGAIALWNDTQPYLPGGILAWPNPNHRQFLAQLTRDRLAKRTDEESRGIAPDLRYQMLTLSREVAQRIPPLREVAAA